MPRRDSVVKSHQTLVAVVILRFQSQFEGLPDSKFTGLVDGELRSRNRTTALAFSRPRRDCLDMRRRLPGLLGRFGGNVAVIADRFWQDSYVLVRRSRQVEASDLGA